MMRRLLLVIFSVIIQPTVSLALDCPLDFTRPNYATRSSYCTMGEKVADYYNFDVEIPCEEMEVDHLIPLKLAHCFGVVGDQLREFANDERNLRFTHWTTNRRKGAKGLLEFSETLAPEMQLRVLKDGIEVMEAYNIPIDKNISIALSSVSKNLGKELVRFRHAFVTPKEAIQSTRASIGWRTARFAGREISILPLEHVPLAGTALALAFIAWDIKDLCTNLTELADLERALYPESETSAFEDEVCGLEPPTIDNIKEQMDNPEKLKEIYEDMLSQFRELEIDVKIPEWPQFDMPELPRLKISDLSGRFGGLFGGE